MARSTNPAASDAPTRTLQSGAAPKLIALGLTFLAASLALAATYAFASAPTAIRPSHTTIAPPATFSYASPGSILSSEVAAPVSGAALADGRTGSNLATGLSLALMPKRDYPTNLDGLPPLPLTAQDLLPAWAKESPPVKDYPTNTEGQPPLVPATRTFALDYYPRLPAPLASQMQDAFARTLAANSYVAEGSQLNNTAGIVTGVLFTQATSESDGVYVHTVRLGSTSPDASGLAANSLGGCTNLEIWSAPVLQRTRCNDLASALTGNSPDALKPRALPVTLLESLLFQCQAVSLLPPDAAKTDSSDGYLCTGDDHEGVGSYDLTLRVRQNDGYVSALDLRSHSASGDEFALQASFSRFGEGASVIPDY